MTPNGVLGDDAAVQLSVQRSDGVSPCFVSVGLDCSRCFVGGTRRVAVALLVGLDV